MAKTQSYSPLDYAKIPPKSIDLEEAVLGALILDGNSIYEIIDDLTAEAFYKDQHQTICQAILNLYETNKKIDMLMVNQELTKRGQLDEIGGPVYVAQLTSKISGSTHIKDHYGIVFQKYIQRQAILFASELNACAFDDSADIDDVIEKLNSGTDLINEKIAGKKEYAHISQILEKSITSLKHREEAAKQNKISGIRTPLIELDKKLQGWRASVVIMAGTTGEGKTAAMLAIAKVAAQEGTPVCIYSLEMEDVTLADRLMLAEADIPVNNYLSGYVSRQDWVEIDRAKARLRQLPIYVDDNPIVGFRYVKTHSRIMKKKGLCGMIMFDYIQLAETEKDPSREREVAKFMRNLVILKKELNVPIIALSQLNRVFEDKRKRPTLANLRESGAIGQDADIVIFIYRPEYHGIKVDEEGNSTEGTGIFILAKNRNGPIGDVKFKYNPSLTKIKDFVAISQVKSEVSNRDRQLPPEKDEFNDIKDNQRDLPF